MNAKTKKHTEAYIMIVAVLLVILYIWWKLQGSSATTSTPETITTSSGPSPLGNGTVNISFQNQPSTQGISTYIPLFGFLRYGAYYG